MEALLAHNKKALFAKLDAVPRIDDNICAVDLIKAVSDRVECDRRYIHKFTPDQMLVLKNKRYLTVEGTKRYIHEGHLFAYATVCEYFKVEPVLPYKEELAGLKKEGGYDTKRILRWLYDRRKYSSKLDPCITLKELVLFATNVAPDCNGEKLAYIKTLI